MQDHGEKLATRRIINVRIHEDGWRNYYLEIFSDKSNDRALCQEFTETILLEELANIKAAIY